MDSLRTEIEQEMKRTRLDKGRLYDLLLKIVDTRVSGGAGAVGPQGPAGPAGPAGPTGPAGPAGECKCASTEATPTPAAKPAAKPSTTKKAPAKKKVVATSVV